MSIRPKNREEGNEWRSPERPDIFIERALGESRESGSAARSVDPCSHDIHTLRRLSEPVSGEGVARTPAVGVANTSEFVPREFFPQLHTVPNHIRRNERKFIRVMKFGGTSVGDALRIVKVAEIIQAASRASGLVVVVSAMSGVTDKLIEAGTQSAAGEHKRVAMILGKLRKQHEKAVGALIHSPAKLEVLVRTTRQLFHQAESLCRDIVLRGDFTLSARDSLSSIGERLSAPLIAAALGERGMASEAIEATELVVTDSTHGAAEPEMHMTHERCEARLRPLVHQGVIPVVTGFFGATSEGVLTTFGRGGSDYSATILAAALDADEVVIWTDVDGLMTADPRLVPDARTIPEISYREAAELAYFGAKVLHPATLRAVMQSGIPVRIRNTFAPERPGTKITSTGSPSSGRVTAITAISDVAMIRVGGPGIVARQDFVSRTIATTAAVRAAVLLISRSSSQSDICVVVSSASAGCVVEALRVEFTRDLDRQEVEYVNLHPDLAIVTVIGQDMRGLSEITGRTCGVLGRENLNIVAIAQGSSDCNISFVVAQKDMEAALVITHREFQLES
jgi:bifunctional aspartokinase / homoserine dehydrogenase 1